MKNGLYLGVLNRRINMTRRPVRRVALVVLAFLLLSTTVVARSYGQRTQEPKLYVFCEADERATALVGKGKGKKIEIGPGLKYAADSLKKVLIEHTLIPYYSPVVYNEQDSPWRGPDILSSDDVSRDLLVAIEECPATPEDTIFFYWSGHGGFDEYGHYLSVPVVTEGGKTGDSAILRRRAIVDALQSKGARLTVLFTDACNVPIDAELNYRGLSENKNKPKNIGDQNSYSDRSRDEDLSLIGASASSITPTTRSPIKLLFFEPEGFIDINSSSPGQASFSQKEKGGYCAQILADAISRPLNYVGIEWTEIFDKLNSGLQDAMEKEGLSRFRIQQSVFCWSTPPAKKGEKWILRKDRWSKPTGRPKSGDRIVAVNSRRVVPENLDDCLKDAYNSLLTFTLDNDETIALDARPLVLTLVDGDDGSTFYLMTDIKRAPDFKPNDDQNEVVKSILGYTVDVDGGEGVVVQSVDENAPGAKCRLFK